MPPWVQLNDNYYECLDPESTCQLLAACKADKLPPMGNGGSLPMNGQVSCEGPLGKTSLATVPPPATVDFNCFNKDAMSIPPPSRNTWPIELMETWLNLAK
eukprot:scaffold96820_cov54-Attheya_sp.AAC.2